MTSLTASVSAPRRVMLMFSVTAATPTPNVMPSCCAMAAKLLAWLILDGGMSA
ncbi:hypothetical protein D3C73_1541700 [compost metagenome]